MTKEELEIMENEIMDSIDDVLRTIKNNQDKKDLLSMIMDSVNDRYHEYMEED